MKQKKGEDEEGGDYYKDGGEGMREMKTTTNESMKYPRVRLLVLCLRFDVFFATSVCLQTHIWAL